MGMKYIVLRLVYACLSKHVTAGSSESVTDRQWPGLCATEGGGGGVRRETCCNGVSVFLILFLCNMLVNDLRFLVIFTYLFCRKFFGPAILTTYGTFHVSAMVDNP